MPLKPPKKNRDPWQRNISGFFQPQPTAELIQFKEWAYALITISENLCQKTMHFFGELPFIPDISSPMKEITTSQHMIDEFRKTLIDKNSPDHFHVWNNYLFLATNNFTEFNVYTITERVKIPDVFARGYRVATASVDDESILTAIEVAPAFRRNKIGAELIKFIAKCCPQFLIFSGTEHNSRYRLTDEGAALVSFCREQNILAHGHLVIGEVPRSPEYNYFEM